jgi:ankyrin repeat protein
MIASHIRDDDGELRYDDFNAFLQVNRALYACLNCMLWKEAGECEVGNQRVLTHLINTNNLARLEYFLELGADLEVHLPALDITGLDVDSIGALAKPDIASTPLLIAADMDNVPLARLLLEKGAKVEYFDRAGGKFSPLHAARSAEMVELLLNHNADPDLEDYIYRRPLHWYAIRDNIAAMRAILQHGAEVNPDLPFEKPIHEAAQRNLDTVELLVEHGADVEDRDHQDNTPLHLAALAGKTDVVKFLVARWPEGTRERNEILATPLYLAAVAEQIDVVKFLVEQWPEGMRERDYGLNTPLHHAAGSGWRVEIMRLLMEGWPGAIKEKNRYGNTPLHLAAWMAQIEVVRLLVERWPEGKEALNNDGKTPLSRFEQDSIRKHQVSDEEKEEIIALLGGQYSKTNNH